MSEPCPIGAEDLAVYAVGAASVEDERRTRSHLSACARCRREVEAQRRVAAVLARARQPVEHPDPHLRARVLHRATARRRRQGTVAAGLVTAALAALLAFPIVVEMAGVVIPVTAEAPYRGDGEVRFRADRGGFVVDVALRNVDALERPGVYEAWMYDAEGRIASLGVLTPDDGQLHVSFTVRRPHTEFRAFWITAEPDAVTASHDGPTVIRTAVPRW